MITKEDVETVERIKKLIGSEMLISETEVDWEKVEMIETLDKMVKNLKIAPQSYKKGAEKDSKYYNAQCPKCGWFGSSMLLDGGGQIADSGDYSDAGCPVCGNIYLDEIP